MTVSRLNVRRGGTKGKPAVVLLHGLGATVRSWEHTVAALAADHETFSIDLWGFGASWPLPKSQDISMAGQAIAVLAALEAEGVKEAALVGHSMGGGVCLHIIDQTIRPGGVLSVTRMALLAPAARRVVGARELAAAITGLIGPDLSPEEVARRLLERIYVATVPEIDRYAAAYSVNFDTARKESLRSQMEQLEDKGSFASRFDNYKVETLLIWGRQDPVVGYRQHGQKLENDLKSARMFPVDDCGHAPHEEYPDLVTAEISEFVS